MNAQKGEEVEFHDGSNAVAKAGRAVHSTLSTTLSTMSHRESRRRSAPLDPQQRATTTSLRESSPSSSSECYHSTSPLVVLGKGDAEEKDKITQDQGTLNSHRHLSATELWSAFLHASHHPTDIRYFFRRFASGGHEKEHIHVSPCITSGSRHSGGRR